jgi:hypothetical protein
MLYVQQSLGPDEEILIGARFHWMYTFQAVMWIMFGLALGIAVGYVGIWWQVADHVRLYYPGLPAELFGPAWNEVVQQSGGYLKLLWTLSPVVRFGILAMFLVGLYLFAHMMIIKATTEIAITTERLIYKRGLIARHVGEIDIDRIEGVSVYQGFLGRIFGYGSVMIRGMGVGEVLLPPIEAPVLFRRAIQEARQTAEKSSNMKSSDDF